MVRITPEPFFKSVTSQGKADQFYCHTTNFIPEVDISGVQHHSLERTINSISHISDMHTHFAAGTGTALVFSRITTALGTGGAILSHTASERIEYSAIH